VPEGRFRPRAHSRSSIYQSRSRSYPLIAGIGRGYTRSVDRLFNDRVCPRPRSLINRSLRSDFIAARRERGGRERERRIEPAQKRIRLRAWCPPSRPCRRHSAVIYQAAASAGFFLLSRDGEMMWPPVLASSLLVLNRRVLFSLPSGHPSDATFATIPARNAISKASSVSDLVRSVAYLKNALASSWILYALR